jgi:hypothetical protein
MKRLQPEDALTESQRDYKRLKLDFEATHEKKNEANAEVKRLHLKLVELANTIDGHPETKAEEAAELLEDMRLSMPATLFRILAEEGDAKHGKLLSFNTTCLIPTKSTPFGFEVLMHFSKTGEHRFKMEECDPGVWSDSCSTFIEGVRRPPAKAYMSAAWHYALAVNDQDVARALAALTIVGFENKRHAVCHDLLDGLKMLEDE